MTEQEACAIMTWRWFIVIVYNDILKQLSESGWSTYRMAKEHLLSPSTIDRIRNDLPINTTTIDTICRLCHCQPGDILSYVPDPEERE